MLAPVAIIIILAAIYLTGRLLLAVFSKQAGGFDGDPVLLHFTSLLAGVLLIGWPAFLLAELGLFSLGTVAVFWLVLNAALALILARTREVHEDSQSQPVVEDNTAAISYLSFLPKWAEYAFLIGWIAVASWLFFRPHQFIIGGADAGAYANLSASINEYGSILMEDQSLADLDPALFPSVLRPLPEQDPGTEVAPSYLFPGYYVTDAHEGKVMPQFYHLHPVWQAVAYGLGGIDSALLMTGLWALLGGLAIYLTIREIIGWQAAAIGLIGLSITALQVWFARYPTTETLAQFLIWGGIWCTMRWLKERRPRALWAFLAGAALGTTMLVRIDLYFLLALPFFLYLFLRWTNRWQKADLWFFVPFGSLAVHSLIHGRFQSTPYFYNTFSYGITLLEKNWILPLLGLMAVALLFLFGNKFRNLAPRIQKYRRLVLLFIVFVVLLLFFYGWFIRPTLGDAEATYDYWYAGGQIPSQLDQQNLVRLGWYLSPLGIALAAAGICLMIWHVNVRTAVILFVGLFFSAFYLWRIQANPHQIYAMRRYVPAVLPFFVIATSYLIGWLMHSRTKWISYTAPALAILWLAAVGWSARGFVSQVDYEGLVTQMENLDSQLESGSVLLFVDENPITLGDIVAEPQLAGRHVERFEL
ncbi:MAG: glycosyltransferase family 39 protein, partial [Candidatus Promineifilaceae bacterium]